MAGRHVARQRGAGAHGHGRRPGRSPAAGRQARSRPCRRRWRSTSSTPSPTCRCGSTSSDDVETTVLLLVAGLDGRRARRPVPLRPGHRPRPVAASSAASTAWPRRSVAGSRHRAGTSTQDELTRAPRPAELPLRGPALRRPYVPARAGWLPSVGQPASIRGRPTGDDMLLPDGGVELPVLARGQHIGRFVLSPARRGRVARAARGRRGHRRPGRRRAGHPANPSGQENTCNGGRHLRADTLAFFALCVAYVRWCDGSSGPSRDWATTTPDTVTEPRRRVAGRSPTDNMMRPGGRRWRWRLPGRRPRLPGAVLMSGRLLARLLIALSASPAAARPLHGQASTRRGPRPATGSSLPIERLVYRLCGVDADTRAALDDLRCALLAFKPRLVPGRLPAAAGPGLAAAQPQRRRVAPTSSWRSTPRSAS